MERPPPRQPLEIAALALAIPFPAFSMGRASAAETAWPLDTTAQPAMPQASSTAPAKTATRRKSNKRGGLTRRQRTTALRRRAGYGTIALVPGGIRITCRESDGFVNLAEIFAAEAEQRGGKPKRLNNWRRLQTSEPFLEAVASTARIRADELLDSGDGQEPWAHPQVACEIAGWLSPALRVAINQLWLDTVNGKARRPRPLNAAAAATVRARKDANLSLADEAHKRGCPPALAHRQLIYALTGSAPEVWAAKLGEGWQDRTAFEFQAVLEAAASLAAFLVSCLPPDSTKRHVFASCRNGAAAALKGLAGGVPVEPNNAGPAISPGRLQRALVAG